MDYIIEIKQLTGEVRNLVHVSRLVHEQEIEAESLEEAQNQAEQIFFQDISFRNDYELNEWHPIKDPQIDLSSWTMTSLGLIDKYYLNIKSINKNDKKDSIPNIDNSVNNTVSNNNNEASRSCCL